MVFSAGTPGGFGSVIGSWGGPAESRPWRPATPGRGDGVTFQVNDPPAGLNSDFSVSVNSRGSPIALPKSSCQTGDVEVWNVFEIFSVEPAGAEPSICEWSERSAVAWSIV